MDRLKPRNPAAYALALRGAGDRMESRRRELLERAAAEERLLEEREAAGQNSGMCPHGSGCGGACGQE